MRTYILQASVDGINIDYEEAIQAAAEPDFWSLEEIAEAHGCAFWTCEEVRP